MANYLLAWELGGGLGHAGRLKLLAAELVRRGHHAALGLRDLVHTRKLLVDLPCPRLQAPAWLHHSVGVPTKPASLAEILLAHGYLDPDALEGLVLGWRDLMRVVSADAVVTDYAPTAILAARILGIPAVAVGPGFWLPPARQALPNLRDWSVLADGRLEESEAKLLRSANEVLRRHGAPAVDQGWQLFAGNRALLCAWPETDHYQRERLPAGEHWYGPTYLPGAGIAPAFPEGEGPRVFAYLKSGYAEHPEVLAALAGAGCRTLCYLPDVAAGKPPPVVDPSIKYSSGPVDLARAFDGAALCVCHAGGATMVQALLAGVPCLLLPMQNEQFLLARRIERTGACVNAGARPRPVDFGALVAELVADGPARRAAAAFANVHAGFSHVQQTIDLCDAIEAIAAPAATDAAMPRSAERRRAGSGRPVR
jgi:hypothetical protein